MNLNKKRLTFQLTPLLDLLLIVIFAQYMDVRETTTATEEEINRKARLEIAAAREEARMLADQLEAMVLDRDQFRAGFDQRLQDLSKELEIALENRKQIATLMAALFNIPKETIEKVIKQQPRSPEEQEQLRKLAAELSSEQRNPAIKHLLAHQAMRKRVDVWELSIDAQGVAHLSASGEQHKFRFRQTRAQELQELQKLPKNQRAKKYAEFQAESVKEFADELFDVYKRLPQPKDIVIILLSWSSAESHWRQPALDGLELALRLMHTNREGIQFVPAVMGLEVEE